MLSSNVLLALSLSGLTALSGPIDSSRATAGPPGGTPLLDFLTTAEVVDRQVITSGINRPLRLTLSDGTTRRDAIFRTVDRSAITRQRNQQVLRVRDHWAFEVAAYRLAELLALDRIPPTTERVVDGIRGSIQLWVENASPGTELIVASAAEGPEGIARRDATLREMALFDLLIHNHDRHLENVLYDEDGRFWWIDHSRTFPPKPGLRQSPTRSQCESPLLQRIGELQQRELRGATEGLLTSREQSALRQRRGLLLRECRQILNMDTGGDEPAPTATTF